MSSRRPRNNPAGRDQDILPDEVKLIQTRELGTAMALEVLWERLGIASALKKIIKQQGYNEAYERALLAMTANRLCEPESKLGVWDRWLSKVYVPSCQGLKLDQMYEAMDFLHAHSSTVEEAVFFRTAISSIWMLISFSTIPPRRHIQLTKRTIDVINNIK